MPLPTGAKGKSSGPPTAQPSLRLAKFVASLSQIPPTGPVLPTQPVYKSFAVYILARDSFHGMEEVIGSIPIRSTKHPLQIPIQKALWLRSIAVQSDAPAVECFSFLRLYPSLNPALELT